MLPPNLFGFIEPLISLVIYDYCVNRHENGNDEGWDPGPLVLTHLCLVQ